jgi:hypothetical protein
MLPTRGSVAVPLPAADRLERGRRHRGTLREGVSSIVNRHSEGVQVTGGLDDDPVAGGRPGVSGSRTTGLRDRDEQRRRDIVVAPSIA